jgi:hypothetical protein
LSVVVAAVVTVPDLVLLKVDLFGELLAAEELVV